MAEPEAGKRYLLELPNELLEWVLLCMPDASTLANAALSCRRLFELFKRNEDTIVSTVLIACIGVSVLPEALLALRCTPQSLSTSIDGEAAWTDEQLAGVQCHYAWHFVQNMRGRRQLPSTYTMKTAIALCDFHVQVVCPLQERFITSRTSPESRLSFPQLRRSLNARPLSQLEKERICRTLYRFEIWRRLFGSERKSCWFGARSDEYFLQYTGWELAQLGCIHDFLAQEVLQGESPKASSYAYWKRSRGTGCLLVFGPVPLVGEDVGSNDMMTQGPFEAKYDVDVNVVGIQHLLAAGLRRVMEFANLSKKSFSVQDAAVRACIKQPEKHRLLFAQEIARLDNLIRDRAAQGGCNRASGFSTTEPFYEDGDQGPEKIWIWESGRRYGDDGHDNVQFYHSIYDKGGASARAWGHVLWDGERHQDLVPQETCEHYWKPLKPIEQNVRLRRDDWEDLTPANAEAWHAYTPRTATWNLSVEPKRFRGHWREAGR